MAKDPLIKFLKNRKLLLEYQINRINASMSSAPDGSIIVRNEKNKSRYYYHKPDETIEYTSNKKLIKDVLQKQYDKKVLTLLTRELRLIDKYLSSPTEKLLADILDGMSEGKKAFIEPVRLEYTDDEYVKRWLNSRYTPKGFGYGAPEHYSMNGLRVRSKSEAMIADMLDKHKVPFFYEYPVVINGITYHPDFCTLNRRTRDTYLWEHLGKMGEENYANEQINRLRIFRNDGYILGKNLIVTMESGECPLNNRDIERVIRDYLL